MQSMHLSRGQDESKRKKAALQLTTAQACAIASYREYIYMCVYLS